MPDRPWSLRDGARELGGIDAVSDLPPGVGRAHEAGAFEHGEVLGHRLPRDGSSRLRPLAVPGPSLASRSSTRRLVGSPIAAQRASSVFRVVAPTSGWRASGRSLRGRRDAGPAGVVASVVLLEHGGLPTLFAACPPRSP